MSISTIQSLFVALSGDLKTANSKGFSKVVNDSTRKIFSSNKDGAIFEFSHCQPDSGFWKGVKYYGSGARNSVRIPRSQSGE